MPREHVLVCGVLLVSGLVEDGQATGLQLDGSAVREAPDAPGSAIVEVKGAVLQGGRMRAGVSATAAQRPRRDSASSSTHLLHPDDNVLNGINVVRPHGGHGKRGSADDCAHFVPAAEGGEVGSAQSALKRVPSRRTARKFLFFLAFEARSVCCVCNPTAPPARAAGPGFPFCCWRCSP